MWLTIAITIHVLPALFFLNHFDNVISRSAHLVLELPWTYVLSYFRVAFWICSCTTCASVQLALLSVVTLPLQVTIIRPLLHLHHTIFFWMKIHAQKFTYIWCKFFIKMQSNIYERSWTLKLHIYSKITHIKSRVTELLCLLNHKSYICLVNKVLIYKVISAIGVQLWKFCSKFSTALI